MLRHDYLRGRNIFSTLMEEQRSTGQKGIDDDYLDK
jgi:hypothetical protein